MLRPYVLLAAFVSLLLAVVARAWRWLVVLDRGDKLADSFWAQSVGFLFTNVFSLRLGEPARVLVMSERCGLPVMQVAASAIVEWLLDGATNVVVVLNQPFMNRSFATLHEKGGSLGVYSLGSVACQRSSGLGAGSPAISRAREPVVAPRSVAAGAASTANRLFLVRGSPAKARRRA